MNKYLDFNSKIKEIYANPIGHDVIYKLLLQLNKKETLITNPVVSNLKLKTVAGLTKKMLGGEFFSTFLELLNSEGDIPVMKQGDITRAWWKEAVFYQIYPRSFQDTDGDGVGDLKGILSRLDYLKELGVDAIWLSPIYDSPNDDNGYDIRDYCAILQEFGTLEDFDLLLQELHKRGMRLIMDLVVNHTSDEHIWFQEAIKNKASKYHDYYLFRESTDGKEPNNWNSFFSGPAWNYYEELEEWGLHLFSKKQMDLNWENRELRAEIQAMIRWWLSRGVDGFRMDVINYISKKEGLPEGNENIGKLMGYYGIEHYYYGPKLHDYLRELKKEAFEPYQSFTVGETPGVGMQMSRLLTGEERKELDMVFSFDHLETPGHVRFEDYRYDLNYLKEYMIDWMENYGDNCWMSVFYENHDNPRMISKVNSDPAVREVLAKLLAMLQLTLKGTPFIYQGQEIGSVNKAFTGIEQMRDVESINYYADLLPTLGQQEAWNKVMSGSRDHARTPMQWSDEKNAGFTAGEPWLGTDMDYKEWNVDRQLEDEGSVLRFYQKLIKLRKEHEALVYGLFEVVNRKTKNVFTYYRSLGTKRWYIETNISSDSISTYVPGKEYKKIMSNYPCDADYLRPYEANLYLRS
ncbi:MAG: malL [Herbinix sp.]|jgi:oligo-1,6-glucosidase|nr:malL [Herbinix sp.]